MRSLPKPVLFGLLGAAGGLIGALLLGELLWWLLRPPTRETTVPPLQVAASKTVPAYPGSKDVAVPAVVARHKFEGAIELDVVSPPEGITVAPATIAAADSEGKVRLTVGPNVAPRKYPMTLRARGPTSDAQAESEVVVEVREPPPAVAVSAPGTVEVYQKGKGRFVVKIARLEFQGPVKVEFDNLPSGVTLPAAEIAAHESERQFEISAGELAPLAKQTISVRVSGPDGTPKASSGFEVAVKKPPPPKVDVVFVIDVSASMDWAIKGVRDGVGTFVEQLKAKNLDFRVGVVLFNNHEDKFSFGGAWKWALKFGNATFTTDPDAVKTEMAKWKANGGGENESSYDGLYEACQLDFRSDANKVLLLVTDEPPLDPKIFPFKTDATVKSKEQMLDVLKSKGIDQLHLVVRPEHHKFFEPLQGGVRTSQGEKYFNLTKVVQDTNSGKGFAELLPELSKEIARITVASGPGSPLAQAPAAPTAESAAIPPSAEVPTRPALIAEGSFAKEDNPRMLLAMAVWSAVVAAGIGLLLAAGQNLYSRRTWYVPLDLLKGAGGGAVAGVIGGAAGELLYQLMPGGAGLVGRLLGWTSLGALSGLGLSFFVPNLRAWKGLAGGAAGGLAGGLAYLAIVWLLGSLFGRLLGTALLGLAIGLMIAFAEQLFRKVWLEVRYGERETITVNLGPEPVKVGGDARACAVFARGAAPVALRFWLREGKVYFEDVPNKRQEEAPVDRPMTVGSLSLTVRSASVPAAAASAPKSPPRPPVLQPIAPPPAGAMTPAPPRPAAPQPSAPAPRLQPTIDEDMDSAPPAKPVVATPPLPPAPARPAAPAKKGDNCPQCGSFVPFKPGFRECTTCGHEF